MNIRRILQAALLPAALCAAPAFAQQRAAVAAPPPVPDNGFFRPGPGISLTQPEPAPPPPAAAAPAQEQAEAPATPAHDPLLEQLWMERQMDRIERENERARREAANAPMRINGAFDGSTDPRDR